MNWLIINDTRLSSKRYGNELPTSHLPVCSHMVRDGTLAHCSHTVGLYAWLFPSRTLPSLWLLINVLFKLLLLSKLIICFMLTGLSHIWLVKVTIKKWKCVWVHIKNISVSRLALPPSTLAYDSHAIQELIKTSKLSSFPTETQMRIQFINFPIVLPFCGHYSSWIFSCNVWILL